MNDDDLIRASAYRPGGREPRPYWTAIGIPQCPGSPSYGSGAERIFQSWPERLFRGDYLIVTTPGWYILEAKCGNVPFLEGIDGDAYSRAEHDRLERMGQLERHHIKFIAQVGNLISFRVKPHYPKLKTDRDFTAVIIGQSLENY